MKKKVVSVSRSDEHRFSKKVCVSITVLEGLGVEDDAHCGKTVKHRSRVAVDPVQPNLRQVHLLHAELLCELEEKGFSVSPGDLGENILTEGIDVLALPRDAILRIGESAVIRVTGLRNPCGQIEEFQKGLLAALIENENKKSIPKAGIMGVVVSSGEVSPGDNIEVELPRIPHLALERV